MRILIFFLALFVSTTAFAADIIIGFKGKMGAFDQKAFEDFAAKRKLKPIVMNMESRLTLINTIKNNPNYELYGYSLGAAHVAYVVKMAYDSNLPMPKRVTTVGAFYSTDVDFRKYNVKFDNYFDASGAGQQSPGKHIGGVNHGAMMRYVTDYYGE
jgi:hypothetical protein